VGRKLALFGLAVVITWIAVSAGFSQKAPVVPDLTIIPPDPTLPEEVKALSGTWTGEWDSRYGWAYTLHVEAVDGESARVVHSWGEYKHSLGGCHCAPNWQRVNKAKVTYSEGQATINLVVPSLQSPNGVPHDVSGLADPSRKWWGWSFSFTVEKNQPTLMKGHFVARRNLRIEMKRVD
jgi:hypothetical protein